MHNVVLANFIKTTNATYTATKKKGKRQWQFSKNYCFNLPLSGAAQAIPTTASRQKTFIVFLDGSPRSSDCLVKIWPFILFGDDPPDNKRHQFW